MENPRFHIPLLENTNVEEFLHSSTSPQGLPLNHTSIAVSQCHAIVHALISNSDDHDNRICMNNEHILNCLHLLDDKLETIHKTINKGMEASYHVSQ